MIDDDVNIKTSKVNLREGGGATPQVFNEKPEKVTLNVRLFV